MRMATDWIVRAGHRLVLAINNTSTHLAEVLLCDFDVDLDSLRLTLPVARDVSARPTTMSVG